MNKLCRQYLSDVKSLFPILGKQEKEYIAKLVHQVEEYSYETEVTSIEEIYTDFGKPEDIVASYYASVDISLLTKRISFAKWVKRSLVILLATALVSVTIYGIFIYNEYAVLKQESIEFSNSSDTLE